MTPRLVIFDFDGTLADTFPRFLEVSDLLADRYRFDRLDRSDLASLRRLDTRQMMKRQRLPLWKLPLIARRARRLMAEAPGGVPLFDGVRLALAALAGRGIRLAMVTSAAHDNVLRALGPTTASLFAELECGVSIFGKARKLRRVVRRTGVAAADALAIGDEVRDAVAARAAGIPFGAVAWGYTDVEVLRAQQPALTFARVAELAEV